MAKNNSFIRLEGTLDGLTFYRKDGNNFVKTKSRVSRNRIMNAPEYQRTRENMQEFKCATKSGKSFRDSFSSISRLVSSSNLTGRVVGIMRRIINNGAGLRGQRTLNLVDNIEPFIGFNFNEQKPFDSHFNAPNSGPTINANRDTVNWMIPDFNTDTYIKKPEGATHFKLVLAAGYTSNYEWVSALQAYEPIEDTPNGVGSVTYSDAIALGAMVGADTDIKVDLTAYAPIPATTALFAGTAIVFYQEVNGELYELAQGHCMKIAVVG
ncbi:hypothetical protein [Winogradskyella pulchriflava]|uniref:Capsid protein n=1 Tax=Winogradskyella pulchriflava TaxID=1110688 RepID=A0ABV6Q9L1_9FLAO